ncbi:retrovirus-related pol polyprotein from transposon TNT 1-94 [Tanacetum coccineum]
MNYNKPTYSQGESSTQGHPLHGKFPPKSYNSLSHEYKPNNMVNMVINQDGGANAQVTPENTPQTAQPNTLSKTHMTARMDQLQIQLNQILLMMQNNNYKIPFHGIFSSLSIVAKVLTVRAFLALAVHKNWSIQQLDINNAFLHEDLHEEWFTKLSTFLLNLNYKQSASDTSLFTLNQDEHSIMLLIYVDDILLVGDCQTLLTNIKQKLLKEFIIKDLGHLNYYMGIEFLRNSSGLTMSQRKYALDLLKQADVLNDKPSITPLNLIASLNETDGDFLSAHEATTYRTIVGKLIYLAITRLDMSFATQLLSQFSHQPRTPH